MAMPGGAGQTPIAGVRIRPMQADDLDTADRVLRLAFGTLHGLSDPQAAFGDTDYVRTRFRAAPDCAWVADRGGEVVGSVLAARWGSFGFFGPLSVHPDLWDRGIGSRLLEPVLAAFARWSVRQAGLFTVPSSPKHLGLYQKHGFWPGHLTVIAAKKVDAQARCPHALASELPDGGRHVLDQTRRLTHAVFPGLDVSREIVAVGEQGLGDTVLVRRGGQLEGFAVCHRGAGSEAGSGTCYVKFAAARPGEAAPARFERLVDACEAFAARSGASLLVVGVNTGRRDAYRRLLARGFRAHQIGVSMRLFPDASHFDTPAHYVIGDLR